RQPEKEQASACGPQPYAASHLKAAPTPHRTHQSNTQMRRGYLINLDHRLTRERGACGPLSVEAGLEELPKAGCAASAALLAGAAGVGIFGGSQHNANGNAEDIEGFPKPVHQITDIGMRSA